MKDTKIINLIAWPWVWKSVIASLLFVQMKIRGFNVELVSEYAKQLVWTHDFDTLNNQYYVSNQQYKLFKSILWKVDYIITDWALLHWIYYNKENKDNISNIEKTEEKIIQYIKEFKNINIFLERNKNIWYEKEWRIQSYTEALIADNELKKILDLNENWNYESFISDVKNIENIINFILKKDNEFVYNNYYKNLYYNYLKYENMSMSRVMILKYSCNDFKLECKSLYHLVFDTLTIMMVICFILCYIQIKKSFKLFFYSNTSSDIFDKLSESIIFSSSKYPFEINCSQLFIKT